jgi:hypothetical protein
VSLDFQRNPILNAEDAEEVYQYLLNSVGDLTESYLNT